MPLLLTKTIDPYATYAVWKISETLDDLTGKLKEASPHMPIKSQLEWASTRLLTSYLCAIHDVPYEGVQKEHSGKPILSHNKAYISISHSFPYACALINLKKPCGIDLELPRKKMISAQTKFLNENEKKQVGDNLELIAQIWCGKEVLIKISGQKNLSLINQLHIQLQEDSKMLGTILQNGQTNQYPIRVETIQNYFLAYNY